MTIDNRFIGVELKSLNNLLRRYHCASPLMKECDNLTGMHGFILGFLFDKTDEGDVFQKDIEKAFEMRRSTVSEILSLMEKNELIERVGVDYDARLKKIVLKPRAIELREKIDKQFEQAETMLTDGVKEKDIDTFLSVLEKMKDNVAKNL